ncbi:hypothetical protein GGR54DRAFT_85469 [Hypoxylon sp. NC1633]|nr:hypothetical protein GGR54DRAFT_85469 [Hypoxylon sp. NC1633]
MVLAYGRGPYIPANSSFTLQAMGNCRRDIAEMAAQEDDEIPLESSSEESPSSCDVSIADSDDKGLIGPLISTGNEHVPPAASVFSIHEIHNMSKKRKPVDVSDTITSVARSKKVKAPDGKGHHRLPSTTATARLSPRLSDKSLLPAEIWHHVFSFTPPRTLGSLLQVNKLFNHYLDPSSRYQCAFPLYFSRRSTPPLSPNAIWQLSRRRFWPRMPAPLQQRTELDMWRLCYGRGCHLCSKIESTIPISPGGRPDVQVIWAFAFRSCVSCLIEKTVKEIDLLLSSSMPSLLISALPFALLTSEMHVVSPDSLKRGLFKTGLQVTKIYRSEDVEKLKMEFFSVKSMGGATAEEWLKGLEIRGKELLSDSMRWEKWASAGGLAQMQTRVSPHSVQGGRFLASVDVLSLDPLSSQSSLSSAAGWRATATPITTVPPSRQDSTLTCKPNDFAGRISSSLRHGAQFSAQASAPRARTREEALGLKAARRAEIERRAMTLNPPLTANILAHIPSFQAAIQIISPLDDSAWYLLKPRLLAQRADAEQREHEISVPSRTAPERSEKHRHAEESGKATKQLIDKTWDDVQAPLRARISAYADEIIQDSWDDGRKVDTENSPLFAAEVLLHVRGRFYAEIANQSAAVQASGQELVEDPPDGPFTQKLTLENLKWLFDSKIKPHTEPYRKEIFFCNDCAANFKAFGLEGVIQHYAAKHTNVLSLGSVVVHWRSEWPETPPFAPDPRLVRSRAAPSYGVSQSQNNVGSHHHGQSAHSYISNPTSFQSSSYFTIPPFDCHPSENGPTVQYPAQTNPYDPEHHEYGPPHPHLPLNRNYNPHRATLMGQSSMSSVLCNEPPAYSVETDVYGHGSSQSNSQFDFQYSHSSSFNSKYYTQLKYLGQTSRELWAATAGLKELPGNIRVCVVIHHATQRFRSRFSEDPPLAMFNDGLSNNKEMRPVRNVNGLLCKACYLGLGDGMVIEHDRRTHSLPQLVNHFQRSHIHQPQAMGLQTLDWTMHMVHTPSLSAVLPNLQYLANMDGQKMSLISNTFPPGSYAQGASNIGLQGAWAEASAAFYTSQQSADSTPTFQSISQYAPLSLQSRAEHGPTSTGAQYQTRAITPEQRLDLSQLNTIGAPHTRSHHNFKHRNSGLVSPESRHGFHGTKLRKLREIPPRDKTATGQISKSREGCRVASSATAKARETVEEDPTADEERRGEEEIRPMRVTERKKIAALTSEYPRSVRAVESDSPRPPLEAGKMADSHIRITPYFESPTYSTLVQSRPSVRGNAEDDLMAGLESQLDRQQVPENLGHERPFLGHHIDSREHMYRIR